MSEKGKINPSLGVLGEAMIKKVGWDTVRGDWSLWAAVGAKAIRSTAEMIEGTGLEPEVVERWRGLLEERGVDTTNLTL